jgi:hypothetical protein
MDNGARGLSEHYLAQAETCCAGKSDTDGYVCWIYSETMNNTSSRRLAAGSSTFDGDEGIFDAFIEAPHIIIGLLSIVLAVAIIWVVLLRFFAKPIVIIVEGVKIGLVIAAGVYQLTNNDDTTASIICFVIAALMVAYVIWQWKTIMFAAKMITHSTIALKENPSVLFGSLVMKFFYAGNAALFVLFFAKSFDVVDVKEVELNGTASYCDFVTPQYLQGMSIFWGVSYLWTVALFSQMRLSIIATVIGSWHFHPEDTPGIFTAIKNVIPSYGTLSVTSLIAALADKVNRYMSKPFWLKMLTFPIDGILCCVGTCIYACVKMFTGYAVVLHTFTGENFIGSARNSFKILSRHFKGGFVTEYTSRSLFTIASYFFSFGVAMIAWVSIDSQFNAGSLPSGGETGQLIWLMWIIVILFNVYYPVLGLYIMIVVNRFLREWERQKMNDNLMGNNMNNDDGVSAIFTDNYNHIWIPPLAATFVGCIAMMFFTFFSSIFLDIITTMFLCFAIDKDNNVEGKEFEALVKEMPEYIDTSSESSDPEASVAIPVKTY